MKCVFCKIAKGEIPKEFNYEDDDIMVFPDIRPAKPVHLLIVPKKHYEDMMAIAEHHLFGKLFKTIQKMIIDNKLDTKGFRVILNGGGAQEIDHLHVHLIGPLSRTAHL